MSIPERAPISTFEITWRTGYIETIEAHQVTWPHKALSMFGEKPETHPRVLIHGEIDGEWGLLLAADADDILTIRRVAANAENADSDA